MFPTKKSPINKGFELSFRFRSAERLKGREEIRKVFAHGRKFSYNGAKLFVVENGLPMNRIAFTFARKYGNAVQRNYSRRLSRESYRLIKARLRSGYDLVLLVYPGGDTFLNRNEQLEILFKKAGLFLEKA